MKGDLVDKVRALMVGMPDTLNVDNLLKRKSEILRISEMCKKDPLYAKSELARFNFYRPIGKVAPDKALLMCWVHMLDRMAKAPTQAHMRGAIVVCFPIIGDILRNRRT